MKWRPIGRICQSSRCNAVKDIPPAPEITPMMIANWRPHFDSHALSLAVLRNLAYSLCPLSILCVIYRPPTVKIEGGDKYGYVGMVRYSTVISDHLRSQLEGKTKDARRRLISYLFRQALKHTAHLRRPVGFLRQSKHQIRMHDISRTFSRRYSH